MEELKACPICHGASQSSFLACKDHTVSGETFALVQCDYCGFVFTNPRPEESAIARYYQSEDYISHSNTQKGFINTLYQWVRNFTIRSKYRKVAGLSSDRRLLDYGAGTGEFLEHCRGKGWDVKGLEPDEGARRFAVQNHHLELETPDRLWDLSDQAFGVITMWHVLEHLHRLNETVEQLKRVLKPGGALVVAVPNRTSWDAAHYEEHWAAYDVPRHLYHFRHEDISGLFERHDMKVEEVHPMKWDAFYVSMLSEKYRDGNVIMGGMRGAISNYKASDRKHTWSSQSYVIRHRD